MRSFVRAGLLVTTVLAAPAFAASVAHAEDAAPGFAGVTMSATAVPDDAAPSASSEADTASHSEIYVTARHRAETSQDVPIALSVVSGATLEATGANNVERLQQLTPTLQFYSSNPRNTSVTIRGFGSPLGLTNDGIDQGVGVYVDDVYYSRVAATTFDFLDVDHVEVLRGPQGTLYGKNTTAGAINITSRAPTFTPEVRGEVSAGNYDYVQAKGAVSGPITDNLAARFAFSKTYRRGTIWNETSHDWNNDLNNLGLRGQLLWKPTTNLDLLLSGDWSHQNTECCATVYAKYVETDRTIARQYPQLSADAGYSLSDAARSPSQRITDVNAELRAKQSFGGASFKGTLRLGSDTLTSITAWRFWDWDPSNDRDFTALDVTSKSQNPSKQQQWTQELRYNHQGKKLDFQVGTFFYYQRINTSGSQVQGEDATQWLLAKPAAYSATNPYYNNVINNLTSTNTIRARNTSWSIYGQANWRPLPRLTIQPGVRLNYDLKKGSYDAVVTDGAGNVLTAGMASTGTATQKAQVGVLLPEDYAARLSDWNVSYDLTVNYEVASNVRAYATYSKTFQTGGINLNGVPANLDGTPQTQFYTVKPESVHSYEIGIKSQWFDHRVTLNLAAFRTDISNYQATFSANNAQSLSSIRGYVANVPEVRSQGLEADFSARPSERLNTYANFAYTDATYRKFDDAPPPLELSGGSTFVGNDCSIPAARASGVSPQGCNIAGEKLPGISKYAFSYGAEANIPANIAGREGQLYLGVDGSYRSSFSSNATPSASTDIKGYALTNFRFGWRTQSDSGRTGLDLFVWARNAFNVTYFEQYQIAPNSTGLVVGNLGDPRTVGATLKFNY